MASLPAASNMLRLARQRLMRSVRGDSLVALGIPLGLVALLVEAYHRSELHEAETPEDCSNLQASQLIQPYHVRQLQERGIVVIQNAMSPSAVDAARQDLFEQLHHQNSEFSFANKSANDISVRQDSIVWVATTTTDCDGEESSRSMPNGIVGIDCDGPLARCLHLVRGVTNALQEQGYNKADSSISYRVPLQCQLAYYPGNQKACYHRHLDAVTQPISELGLLEWLRLSDYRARSLTAILYLNKPDRPECAGGALRCWINHGTDDDSTTIDVHPRGGTLVILESAKIEHMVLPSSVDRYALTSWVFREG
jgi:hypothetical protein